MYNLLKKGIASLIVLFSGHLYHATTTTPPVQEVYEQKIILTAQEIEKIILKNQQILHDYQKQRKLTYGMFKAISNDHIKQLSAALVERNKIIINSDREKAIGAGIFLGFIIATLLIKASHWYTQKTFSNSALNSSEKKKKAIVRTLLLIAIFWLGSKAITRGCQNIQAMTDIRNNIPHQRGHIHI